MTEEVKIIIKAVADQAKQAITGFAESSQNSASKVATAFGNATKTLATGMVIAGTAVATTGTGIATFGVHSAASLEQTKVAFGTMLGSAQKAGVLLKDLAQFAATTPFEFPEVATSAKTLLAFGVQASNIKNVLKQVGDVASGIGAPFQDIAYLYGQMKAQNTIYTQDLNQLSTRGIPILDLLAKKYHVTTAEIRNMASQGKLTFQDVDYAFSEMTKSGGQFYNMMDAQSHTFNGAISTIQDNFKAFAMSIVGVSQDGEIRKGGIFYYLKEGVLGWSGTIDKSSSDFARFVATIKGAIGEVASYLTGADVGDGGDFLTKLFGEDKAQIIIRSLGTTYTIANNIINGFKASLPTVENLLGKIGDALGKAFGWIIANRGPLTASLIAVGVTVATMVAPAFGAWAAAAISAAAGTVIAAAPVIAILAAVGVAAFFLYKAWQSNWGGMRDKVQEVWQWIQEYIIPVLKSAGQNIVQNFSIGMDFLTNSFIPTVVNIGKTIWAVAQDIGSAVSSFVTAFMNGIQTVYNFFAPIIGNMKMIFVGLFDIFSGIVKFFVAVFTGNWEAAGHAITTIFQGILDVVTNMFMLVVNTITMAIGGLVGFFMSLPATLWKNAQQFGGIIATGMQNMVNSTINIGSGILTWWQGLPGKIGTAMQQIPGLVTEQFKHLAEIVKNIHIPSPHFKKSGDISFGPVKLPSFDIDWYKMGGSFVANGKQLIGVGDNTSGAEKVTIKPLSGFSTDSEDGGVRDVTININGYNQSPMELAQIIKQIFARDNQNTQLGFNTGL